VVELAAGELVGDLREGARGPGGRDALQGMMRPAGMESRVAITVCAAAAAWAVACGETETLDEDVCVDGCTAILVCRGATDRETAESTCRDATQADFIAACANDWEDCTVEELAGVSACLDTYEGTCDDTGVAECLAPIGCSSDEFLDELGAP
jgi:hypothetical protein